LAYLDDYAFLIWALIELYETTYKPMYLKKAMELTNDMIKYFWDNKKGGLFIYGSDSEQLITRPKEIYDGAIPSGNSVAALNFLRLSRLTGQQELEEKAHQMFALFGSKIDSMPQGYAFFLTAMLFGDITADYLTKQLKTTLPNIPIYRLGTGLPVGGELNYADKATLRAAFMTKHKVGDGND